MSAPSVHPRSVLVLGGTGLVGSSCLRLALDEPAIGRVVALTRRPLPPMAPPHDAKLQARVVDFDDLDAAADAFHVDAIICALGTTIKQAGSEERFRSVDYDYPLAAARLGLRQGARHFLLVSALGASATSRVFYNRVKGELEGALRSLGYDRLTIVRPSLLLGARAELRLGERVAASFAWAVPAKWKPVPATAVAATLIRALSAGAPGVHVIESADIHS